LSATWERSVGTIMVVIYGLVYLGGKIINTISSAFQAYSLAVKTRGINSCFRWLKYPAVWGHSVIFAHLKN
jgi:hypothetical protein